MPTQAEIRRAELDRERGRRPITILALRLAELNRLLTARHGGEVLADDDAGRDDVELVAHHLARGNGDPARRIASWIQLRAPWMAAAEREQLISRVTENPRRWRADSLARRLNLTASERRRLKLWTIGAVDCDRDQRAANRAARKRDRDRRRAASKRIADGRKPRADYRAAALTKIRPWAGAGISRRTWERRRDRVASPSPTIDLSVC
jgi:hypothetical protein